MRISVLQQKTRYGYDEKTSSPSLEFLKEQAALTLNDTFEMLDEAGRRGSDLAVTIECVNGHLKCSDTRWPFTEVYEGLDGPTVKRFAQKAKEWKMHIVAGLYLVIEGKAYNCAVLFDDEGEIVGVHRKVHLPAGEEFQITHGDRYDVFETKLGKIGMLVCWDMQFPEAPRIMALKGAELIALPTWGWENIYGLCRAYENGVTVAAAMGIDGCSQLPDFCDPSCIVDHMGRIAASGDREHSAVVTADIDIHQEPAPQYGSEHYIDSMSMRKTRFSQRRPATYGLLSEPLTETPLYEQYYMTDHTRLSMRHEDRRISDPLLLEAVLAMNHVCTLAMYDEPWPYVTPIHYGYEKDGDSFVLYFHMAKSGHRLDLLEKNPNVTVNIYSYLNRAGHSKYRGELQDYRSVTIFGKAEEVTDLEEILTGLNSLQRGGKRPLLTRLSPNITDTLTLLRVRAEQITGKSNYPISSLDEVMIPPLSN